MRIATVAGQPDGFRQPYRKDTLLGEGGGVEDEHGVGPADLAGDLSDQFVQERAVIPIDLAEEPLDDLSVQVVAVGDRLGVLALDVGEQAGEIGAGMAAALGAGERGRERHGELVQSGDRPLEERGRDLAVLQQLFLAAPEARLHRWAPSIG